MERICVPGSGTCRHTQASVAWAHFWQAGQQGGKHLKSIQHIELTLASNKTRFWAKSASKIGINDSHSNKKGQKPKENNLKTKQWSITRWKFSPSAWTDRTSAQSVTGKIFFQLLMSPHENPSPFKGPGNMEVSSTPHPVLKAEHWPCKSLTPFIHPLFPTKFYRPEKISWNV